MNKRTPLPQNGKPYEAQKLPQHLPNNRLERAYSRKPEPPDDNSIRWFLVRCIVILMFLDLAIYAITGDIRLLLPGTLLGVAVSAVFTFYFTRK